MQPRKVCLHLLACVTMALALMLCACGDADMNGGRRRVSMRLPIPVADAAFVPYYLAQDEGYFRDEGLDVQIEPGSAELNPVKMVAQGTDDFAVLGGPELLFSARARNVPLVAIGQIHKDADFVVLLTLAGSGLRSVQDLEGRDVGFFYGHISTDILHMLFRTTGVGVNEVDVGFDYSQLVGGNLAAQWAFRTTAGISLPARGVAVNVISPAEYGIHTQGHILVATDSTVERRPAVTAAFVRAVVRGIERSLESRQDALQAVLRRDPAFDPGVFERQMDVYDAAIRRNRRIAWIDSSDMAITKEQMVACELLAPEFDPEAAYTTAFVTASDE